MKRYLILALYLSFSQFVFSHPIDTLNTKKFDSINNVLAQKILEISNNNLNQSKTIENLQVKISEIDNDDNSDLVVSILALAVALGLLVLTHQNNKKSQFVLQQQICYMGLQVEEQKKINRAQQRPIVDAYRSGWKEKTELIMINYGSGPAILTDIFFEKPNYPKASTIADLIDLKKIDKDIWWDDKWSYNDKNYYLYPQQKVKLYTITKKNLMDKYQKSSEEAESIIKKVRDARDGISFNVKYTDLISIDNDTDKEEYETNINLFNNKTSG